MAADRRARRPRRGGTGEAGFTLIEIIVSVLIMGMMLAAISQMLTSVRMSRDLVHNIREIHLAGPAILDLIERDLRAIFTTQIPRELHLKVENRVMAGEDADRIDFFTSTDSLLVRYEGERGVRADVNEVGYCLRPNPRNDDFLEIYRREGFGIDEDPQRGGQYIFLHDHIVSFDVEVYAEDGPDTDPLEEWGEDPTDPETQGLPTSLRLRLVIELEPRLLREQLGFMRLKQKRTYERIVRLPESLRMAEAAIPRLGVPTPGGAGADAPPTAPGQGETGRESGTGGGDVIVGEQIDPPPTTTGGGDG